ncbi:MAG TPA: hypothetical protein VN517_03820 [Terriglobales bacterium]|nr:hypothetical protein [Terriglobales bacterium]
MSAKEKDTVKLPYRVEFRFRRGTRHYEYFGSMDDANKASYTRRFYTPLGHPSIEFPLSQQTQQRGPRNGWSAV